ncbi:hypothetical protein DPMN_018353 [Dreissena polymorpha]|uniref:EGF-like domain-containing protein n=1 Tax=Dreissena polymorpha TaxID=45954 RepID=A0A9D4S776_DREPO|nr:hypothetical protein DPMN_018353 [Dreissena polymorpha]
MANIVCLVALFFVQCIYAHGPSNSEGISESSTTLFLYTCNGDNGVPCSGHGSCYSGVCSCNIGFTGITCELQIGGALNVNNTEIRDRSLLDLLQSGFNLLSTLDTEMASFRSGNNTVEVANFPVMERETVVPLSACSATERDPCNGNGRCRSGACDCMPGYSGFRCELSSSVGFCNTYRACAECTAFLEVCPDSCAYMAQFNLVYGFPTTVSSGFGSCRSRSAVRRCSIFYMQESETPQGWKTIIVKPCPSEMDPLSSVPPFISTTSSDASVFDDKTSATTGTTQSSTSQSVSTSTTGFTRSSTSQSLSTSTIGTTRSSTSQALTTSTTGTTRSPTTQGVSTSTTTPTIKAILDTPTPLPTDTQHDGHKVGHSDRATAAPKGAGSASHANLVLFLGSIVVLLNI